MSSYRSDSDSESSLSSVDSSHDATPLFEDDISGNLISFAAESEEEEDNTEGLPTSNRLVDIGLEAFQCDNPMDALRFFWQPSHGANHQLRLVRVRLG